MGDLKCAEGVEKQLAELKDWVAGQPHIPKDMDDKLLRRFLHSCYYDMKKAQAAMEAFTSIRASSPEIFADRDPLSPRVQKGLKLANMALLKMSGNRNLWIMQLNDPGLNNFDHLEFVRNFIITIDAWFLEEDALEEADITIMDAKDISWKIFWKINMSVARKLAKYQEEALPIRIKQMHMVNAPPFMDKLFLIMKQFMSKEMTDLVHFHTPNSDTLFEFISRDELPKDFGGNLASLEEQNKRVMELLIKHRESLLNDDLWRAPEKKTKNNWKNSTSAVTQISDASFRSMAID